MDPENNNLEWSGALGHEVNFTGAYKTPSGRAGEILTPTKGTSVIVAVKADEKLKQNSSDTDGLTFEPEIGFRDSNGNWDSSPLSGSYTSITAYVSNGRIQYYIGGNLHIDADDTEADETYTGTFTIQVSCISSGRIR